MTSSAGASGFTRSGLPPSLTIASRIAARSTMQGTPVKSCRMTRAGVKAISCEGAALGFQSSSASMSLVSDVDAVFEAQQVFEQDFQRIRQARHLLLRERGEAHDLVSCVSLTLSVERALKLSVMGVYPREKRSRAII